MKRVGPKSGPPGIKCSLHDLPSGRFDGHPGGLPACPGPTGRNINTGWSRNTGHTRTEFSMIYSPTLTLVQVATVAERAGKASCRTRLYWGQTKEFIQLDF